MMKEIEAKTVLRKHKKIDSWFSSYFGANLYRGCAHNCAYCDGRTEKYQVDGEFGRNVSVKINALEILERELDPRRKRKPMPKGFFMIGGGVCDTYQPIERRYKLTRGALELALAYEYPVHLLTKSTLVERDIDLLKEINRQSKAIVSFSFSSIDDSISRMFEPGVPSPTARLATITKLKQAGLSCGLFLMPVIPLLTDTQEKIEAPVGAANEAGVDFIIFGSMTLKAGRQMEYFFNVLDKHFPELRSLYTSIYAGYRTGYGTDHTGDSQFRHVFVL